MPGWGGAAGELAGLAGRSGRPAECWGLVRARCAR